MAKRPDGTSAVQWLRESVVRRTWTNLNDNWHLLGAGQTDWSDDPEIEEIIRLNEELLELVEYKLKAIQTGL